jgi:hypothetical protein
LLSLRQRASTRWRITQPFFRFGARIGQLASIPLHKPIPNIVGAYIPARLDLGQRWALL